MSRGFGPIEDMDAWRKQALEEIGDRQVVCSISGGKDSTSMALLLKELDIPYINVHLDTGWEHHATERYVREYLPDIIGPIQIIRRRQGGMVELIKKQAGFPGGNQRFCTRELKIIPMRDFFDGCSFEPINTVGIRAAESHKRSKMPEWDYSNTMHSAVWRPIIRFTEDDVFDMHRRHNVELNPLYAAGCSRVGCWPCVYARKSEIKRFHQLDPKRVDLIRELEHHVAKLRSKRNEIRNKPNATPPTWFAHRLAAWSIDEVIAWAYSEVGSKRWREQFDETDASMDLKARIAELQPEVFEAPSHEQGCMRWGLCETVDPNEA